MYVRTEGPPAALVGTLREVVRELDASLPIHEMRTIQAQMQYSLVNERFVASLSAVLGVLATLLAMVGLYGVMAYTVACRTRDIAVRVAFGAVASRVTTLIVRDMLMLVMIGVVLALPALWWLQRYVSSQLYGVSPTDPFSVMLAMATLFGAAAIAILVPCRRALRIDPMIALRQE